MLIDPLGSDKAKWARTAPHTGRLPTIQRAPQLVHPHSNSSYSLPAVCIPCHCLLRVLNALCYEIVSTAHKVPLIIPIPWRISGLERLTYLLEPLLITGSSSDSKAHTSHSTRAIVITQSKD